MMWTLSMSLFDQDDEADGQHHHERIEATDAQFAVRMADMEKRLQRLEAVVDVLSRTTGSTDDGWSDHQA